MQISTARFYISRIGRRYDVRRYPFPRFRVVDRLAQRVVRSFCIRAVTCRGSAVAFARRR